MINFNVLRRAKGSRAFAVVGTIAVSVENTGTIFEALTKAGFNHCGVSWAAYAAELRDTKKGYNVEFFEDLGGSYGRDLVLAKLERI